MDYDLELVHSKCFCSMFLSILCSRALVFYQEPKSPIFELLLLLF